MLKIDDRHSDLGASYGGEFALISAGSTTTNYLKGETAWPT